MSRLKIALVVLALLAAAGVGGALFRITRPEFQRALVLEKLADAGIPAEVGAVSVSLGGDVRVERLVLKLPELRLECREGTARVALPALLSREIRVTALDITGAVADFTEKTPPPPKRETDDDGDAARKTARLFVSGKRVAGDVVLPDGRRLTGALAGITLTNTGACSLDFEFTGSAAALAGAAGGAGAAAPSASAAKAGTLKGSVKASWNAVAPLRKAPKTYAELVALGATFELSLAQRSATGTVSNLELTASPARNHLKWWLKALNAGASMQSEGVHETGGAVRADLKFSGFDTASFPFIEFLPAGALAALPEFSRLDGSIALTRANFAAPFEVVFRFNDGVAGDLGSFAPALAGVSGVRLRLDGSGRWSPSGAKEWELKLPRVFLTADKEGLPLLDGALTASGARNRPVSFGASARASVAGLAVQPRWRELLAPFAHDNWRVSLAVSGQAHPAAKDAAAGAPAALPRVVLNALDISAGRAAAGAGTSAAAPAFTAKLLRPLDTAAGAADGRPDITLAADRFPLALATPFIGGAEISGTATGTITLGRTAKRLCLATAGGRPLTLGELSFTDAAGTARLRALNISARAAFNFARDLSAWEFSLAGASVSVAKPDAAGAPRPLTGSLALSWDAKGLATLRPNLFGDPSALLHQPLLGSFPNLESVTAQLRGEYTRGGRVSLLAVLDHLRGRGELGEIRRVAARADGSLNPASPVLEAPARLDGGERTSDLALSVKSAPKTAAGEPRWTASVRGNFLDVSDAARLVAILSPAPSPKRAGAAADDAPPATAAAWAALGRGDLSVAIARILVTGALPRDGAGAAPTVPDAPAVGGGAGAADVLVDTETGEPLPPLPPLPPIAGVGDAAAGGAVTGAAAGGGAETRAPIRAAVRAPRAPHIILAGNSASVAVMPATLSLRSLSLGFPFSRLLGTGALAFKDGTYTGSANATMKDLPLRRYIAFFSPDAGGTLDGRFSLSAKATLAAPTLAKTASTAAVEITAESAAGSVRLFRRERGAARLAGDAAGLAGDAAGLASSLLGSRGRTAGGLRAFQKIQRALNEFNYDKAVLKVSRDPAGTWRVNTLRIANAEIAITGTGSLTPVAGAPWDEAKLDITAGFAARGDIAGALRDLKLGSGAPDAAGYLPGPEFAFSGTPASVKNNLLFKLAEAAKKAVSSVEDAAGGALQDGADLIRGFGL
ncbi:MAG: hypothetical protein LBR07_08320 [Puniceicoccales bacterium]|jgi:hypothetical protein|nr:hypothetical protein [Puniceicoccales bacterium]